MTQLLKVLVSSSEPGIHDYLIQGLAISEYKVVSVRPGAEFLSTVRTEHPLIAVVDSIQQRPEAVQMEISLLKDICPEVRIIVRSENSTLEDASIVEQGIFYYTSGPIGKELLEAVEAAAHSLERKGCVPAKTSPGKKASRRT